MAEKITLARPYAKAIFEMALEQQDFKKWSDMLQLLTEVSEDESVQHLLSDFTIPPQETIGFFIDLLDAQLNTYGKNLIKILGEKRKLFLIPTIEFLYEKLRNDAENILNVECISAIVLTEEEQKQFISVLQRRLGSKINLICSVDPDLIGGFIIKAKDKVIDGSLKGQILRLKEAMGGEYVIKSF